MVRRKDYPCLGIIFPFSYTARYAKVALGPGIAELLRLQAVDIYGIQS